MPTLVDRSTTVEPVTHQNKNGRNGQSGSDPNPGGLRRSKRTPQPRDLYCQTHIEKNKVLVTELDEQRGLDQPGRNFIKSPEDETRKNHRKWGKDVYDKALRKCGWTYKPNHGLESEWVFLAPGVTQETGEEGVNMFYEYEEIWRKWDDSDDEDFRRMIQKMVKRKTNQNKRSENDANAHPRTTHITTSRKARENSPSVDYNRLGDPTPGVSQVARRPNESNAKAAETNEEEDSTAHRKHAKRGHPSNPKSKKNKRHKKKKDSSSLPPLQVEISHGTAVAGRANVSLRIQDQPNVVTPTSANSQDTPDALFLSEAKKTIDKLKKKLRDALNDAEAQRMEIEDLRNENDRLRKEKAKEKVASQGKIRRLEEQCEKWKDKCEMHQVQIKEAMEQGFQCEM